MCVLQKPSLFGGQFVGATGLAPEDALEQVSGLRSSLAGLQETVVHAFNELQSVLHDSFVSTGV